jgi:hypothetical protein
LLPTCTVKPDDAVVVEHQGVRVLRRGIGHPVFGHAASLRIELADEAGEITGEPDVAVLVLLQAVGDRCAG